MDRFTIITALTDYAASKNWHVLHGNNFEQNYKASQIAYESGELVLAIFPFESTVGRVTSNLGEITYSGLLLLGRKFEDTTECSLDETYSQKYARRLKELTPLLANSMLEFACLNELEHTARIAEEINKLDTNVDFVGGLYTFYQ